MTTRQNDGPETVPDHHELVTCVLGGVEFGLDISAVQEIVRLPKITAVPRAPAFVEGVANLRGNVLPIINSRSRFGLPPADAAENTRVVVVELNGHPTGMIVDAVREVMHVRHEDLEPAPAVVQSIDGRFLRGVVKMDGGQRLVLLLDHSAILESQALVASTEHNPLDSETPENATKIDTHSLDSTEHLVTFRIGEEEYAIPIMDVQEIIRVPSMSSLPNAPTGVIGIANLRNRILPVLDIRILFGLRPLQEELAVLQSVLREQERAMLDAALESSNRADWKVFQQFDRWQQRASAQDPTLQQMLAPVREAAQAVFAALQSGKTPTLLAESLAFAMEKLQTGLSRRDSERCLVVGIQGTPVALRVDAVHQVLQASRQSVEPTPPMLAGPLRERIRGIAKLDDGKRLILLLDASKLISGSEWTAMDTTTAKAREAEERKMVETDERQLVTFRVAEEEFAVDIMLVQEIIRLGKVTKVPQVPVFVEGVVNLRGNVLPVIDLRKRVNLASRDHTDATRVLVVDLAGVKTGIIVDAVSEVLRVHGRHIEPAPMIVRSRFGDQIIEGVGKLNKGERMFLLLRAEELLKSSDSMPALTA